MQPLESKVLLEQVASQALDVEFHDRDLTKEKELNLLIDFESRYQRLVQVRDDDNATSEERTIFELDACFKQERVHALLVAGDHYTHGLVRFRLSELLDTSQQLSTAFRKNQSLSTGCDPAPRSACQLRLKSPIIPQKRRVYPKSSEGEEALFSAPDRLVRAPASYLDASSSLRMEFELSHPLVSLSLSHKPVEAGGITYVHQRSK